MTRYFISFDDGAMDHIPDEDGPAVGEAAHAVVRQAQDANVWVFGGGLRSSLDTNVVSVDGSVINVPYAEGTTYLGGFAIVDVASREEALRWAAKFAEACRCSQNVREIMDDPLV